MGLSSSSFTNIKKKGFNLTIHITQNLHMHQMATQSPQPNTESTLDVPTPSQFLFVENRYCFCIPYRFHNVRSSSPDHNSDKTLWSRGIDALKKIREWSELLAGPRWKTFIRRFNRNKNLTRQSSRFQYDPLDYALNFDEGPLENGDSETESEYMVRSFSSRYAVPVGSKMSMDLGKDAIGSNCV